MIMRFSKETFMQMSDEDALTFVHKRLVVKRADSLTCHDGIIVGLIENTPQALTMPDVTKYMGFKIEGRFENFDLLFFDSKIEYVEIW
jgi:hypothetical protein